VWLKTIAVGLVLCVGLAGQARLFAQVRLVGSSGNTSNRLSQAEEKAGWMLMFDGRTTDGWRNFRKDTVGGGWQVKGGALCRVGSGAGDIISDEQFGNFELSIEYRISSGGNSGIMFRVTEDESTPWRTGPEIQVQDNDDGHDPQLSGWLYQLYKPGNDPATGKTADATRPVGEWNQVQLRVTEAGGEINVNGIRYGSFKIGSDDWNRRVAKSKFADLPMFGKAARGHIALQDHGDEVAYRNIKIRELGPAGEAPEPIDGELAVGVELAFEQLEWAGWSPVDDNGRRQSFRPIVLTHAGDGSNRVFVAEQHGAIHVLNNKQDVAESKMFLDIRDRVSYKDSENEEGLLGMAFHPNFKENGEVYVYYSAQDPPRTSVISRFRVSADDANRADAATEEQLLVIDQPFWNHNGGTIAFGPDGYLYIGLGDGGAGNDPYGNAQNLGVLLGSILRIDVDRKGADGAAYAIPADNPFVDRDGARPEIYAYGLRNVWRLAFDAETGVLWCGDVGQNLWEEISLIEKGGNYGWNRRESMHAFGSQGAGPNDKMIEPIWEYDHQVGKSITGGSVYRGSRVAELAGKYIYADYVSGKIYALDYDAASGAVKNYRVPSPMLPIISFGEDEQHDVYFMIVAPDGRGIYRFTSGG
jgi:glucose/arabinose dehydrogenase